MITAQTSRIVLGSPGGREGILGGPSGIGKIWIEESRRILSRMGKGR